MSHTLQRAWARATRAERLQFVIAVSESLVDESNAMDDGGRLLGWTGPRPGSPARTTPRELVELVFVSGYTLSSVARQLRVSTRSVRRWWGGQHAPQKRHIERLRAVALRE